MSDTPYTTAEIAHAAVGVRAAADSQEPARRTGVQAEIRIENRGCPLPSVILVSRFDVLDFLGPFDSLSRAWPT